MKKVRLNPISKKRQKQMSKYNTLIIVLRELCNNKSELSHQNPDWQSKWKVEPHHIDKRNGKRLLNPFGIIMLTRTEHDLEEGKIKGEKVGKEKLLALVKDIRIKQEFVPND